MLERELAMLQLSFGKSLYARLGCEERREGSAAGVVPCSTTGAGEVAGEAWLLSPRDEGVSAA